MRFRDRGAGALLMLALLLFMAGALSRFVPETWPGAVVPRFAETIAPWLLIWALLVALLARLFGARRGGGVLALCCLLAAGGMVLDHLRLSRPVVAGPGQIRVLFFNVLYSNAANAEAITGMVLEVNPDIAIFAESKGIAPARDLLRAHFLHVPDCGDAFCPLQVYSHLPLHGVRYRSLNALSHTNYVSSRVELAGQEVTVSAVHLLKPWVSGYARRERDYLGAALEKDRGAGGQNPTLLIGDFNAPPWTSTLSTILRRTGLRDLRWTPGTWPPEMGDLGLPLDHALTGGGLRVVSLMPVGEGLGSNHRGILVELVLEE